MFRATARTAIHPLIQWIRSTFISIPLIVAATILASTAALVFGWFAPRQHRQRVAESCKRAWARFILAASFVRLTVDGLENVPRSQPVIFCANHLSYLDPPVLIAVFPVPVRFLAKKSLFAIPFLGWAMRLEGNVAINRENARAAARGLALAEQRLRAGTSFVIFPEGGRSEDGTLQPLLSGAFRLGIAAQVPMIPVAIRGTREALQPGSLLLRGGAVRIAVGQPVLGQNLGRKDAEGLNSRVEAAIRALLSDDKHEQRGTA